MLPVEEQMLPFGGKQILVGKVEGVELLKKSLMEMVEIAESEQENQKKLIWMLDLKSEDCCHLLQEVEGEAEPCHHWIHVLFVEFVYQSCVVQQLTHQ